MPMLSIEEVGHVISRWQDTDSEDWERIVADYIPQGAPDKIENMIREMEMVKLRPELVDHFAAIFMAGLELGWWLACACEARNG